MKKSFDKRGFKDFIGEEIIKVDTTSINVVHFICKSGKVISVDAEESNYGIPVLSVNEWSK